MGIVLTAFFLVCVALVSPSDATTFLLDDADSSDIHVLRKGVFEKYVPESDQLPEVQSSADWYSGQRDHLGFASIIEHPN